jgi:uncharacterized membrane protein
VAVRHSLVGRLFLLALGLVVVATLIGVYELWPEDRSLPAATGANSQDTERAEVTAIRSELCPVPGAQRCLRVTARLETGPDKDEETTFAVVDAARQVGLDVGDEVRLAPNPLPPGASIGGVRPDRYSLADFERRLPLLWLGLAFAALVVISGRLKGARALVGLALSLVIIVGFVVPSILDGGSPEGVALVGALAIMLVTIPLAHGPGPTAVAACLGTTVALLLTLGLASFFTDFAHITGLSSDEAIYLRATSSEVSLQGLLLAGMVIGALGVLDDLTVTQSSIVLALHRTDPALGTTGLFRGALAVGHDHIAATVNTLFLAYAGAALPVLLIFNLSGTSFSDAVNNEAVAAEVVATLVGSIGLIAAVPITTAIAALLATQSSVDAVPAAHPHAH